MENEKIWKKDKKYLAYVGDHYPEAIALIKKHSKIFNNKWIDIQSFDEYSHKTSSGYWLPGVDGKTLFKIIYFDVFDRKIKPQYDGNDPHSNAYITWKTATLDIHNQRSEGIDGEPWIAECALNIEEIPCKPKKIWVDGQKFTEYNHDYTSYLDSEEYKRYQEELLQYESAIGYRKQFHDFTLPDGSVKSVLFYFNPEGKYEELKRLGVSKEEIEKSKNMLYASTASIARPVPPPAPPKLNTLEIPGYYKEENVPPKIIWHHYIKSIVKE